MTMTRTAYVRGLECGCTMNIHASKKRGNAAERRASLARCAPSALITGKPLLPSIASEVARTAIMAKVARREGKLNPEAAELMSAVKGEEGAKGDERSAAAAAGGARKEGRKEGRQSDRNGSIIHLHDN